jgi:hypothetical protein
VERIGRLHAERRKRIAELRDRLFIWSRTAIAHSSGRDAIHRQETGIGIEAQREKEYDECAGEDRMGAMSIHSHLITLSLFTSHVNDGLHTVVHQF